MTIGPKLGELFVHSFALHPDKTTDFSDIPGMSNWNICCHLYEEPKVDNTERIIPVCSGISAGEDPLSESCAMT